MTITALLKQNNKYDEPGNARLNYLKLDRLTTELPILFTDIDDKINDCLDNQSHVNYLLTQLLQIYEEENNTTNMQHVESLIKDLTKINFDLLEDLLEQTTISFNNLQRYYQNNYIKTVSRQKIKD